MDEAMNLTQGGSNIMRSHEDHPNYSKTFCKHYEASKLISLCVSSLCKVFFYAPPP